MHEPEEKREEKLEGHEIRLGSTVAREERPHGKLYRWFDNYWYHHKWKTIIIAFFLVVFVICTAQMCSKDPEADVNILIVGPTNFITESGGSTELEALLSGYVTVDYNEDGSKNVDIRYYTVLSKEQIQKIESTKDEDGKNLQVDHAAATNNYNNFYSYLSTGETAILILDRWVFDEIKAKGLLVDLSSQMESAPSGTIFESGESGSFFGISLRDTALYEQSAFHVLEEDYIDEEPVLCMLSKLITTNDEKYDVAMDYFKSLVG